MATSNDLMQDVYANFLSAYARSTSAGNTVIAFEALGISPGLDPSAAGSKAAALEYISNEADAVPDLASGSYQRSMRTISFGYSSLVSNSLPVTQSDGFNSLKAAAVESLHNFTLGSANGPSTFKPAYAAPTDWFDASRAVNWASYSYNAGTPAPVNPRPPIRVPIWRLMRTQEITAIADTPAIAQAAPVAQAVPVVQAAPVTQAVSSVHANRFASAAALETVASPMGTAISSRTTSAQLENTSLSDARVGNRLSDRVAINPLSITLNRSLSAMIATILSCSRNSPFPFNTASCS